MSETDKGARPKDYKTVDSQNVEDVIKNLEKEERDLRRDLKKMTPKKNASHNVDPDLNALQAQRDELKRQVIMKRENSEKMRVKREIEELNRELASLDSPQVTAGASKITIKDLRKMGSLKTIVDSKTEPTYFDEDDTDDSPREDDSEGKNYCSQIYRTRKSGKTAKSSEISVN